MHVDPFLVWKGLPGFDRLELALSLAEKVAFAPEGFPDEYGHSVRSSSMRQVAHTPFFRVTTSVSLPRIGKSTDQSECHSRRPTRFPIVVAMRLT